MWDLTEKLFTNGTIIYSKNKSTCLIDRTNHNRLLSNFSYFICSPVTHLSCTFAPHYRCKKQLYRESDNGKGIFQALIYRVNRLVFSVPIHLIKWYVPFSRVVWHFQNFHFFPPKLTTSNSHPCLNMLPRVTKWLPFDSTHLQLHYHITYTPPRPL